MLRALAGTGAGGGAGLVAAAAGAAAGAAAAAGGGAAAVAGGGSVLDGRLKNQTRNTSSRTPAAAATIGPALRDDGDFGRSHRRCRNRSGHGRRLEIHRYGRRPIGIRIRRAHRGRRQCHRDSRRLVSRRHGRRGYVWRRWKICGRRRRRCRRRSGRRWTRGKIGSHLADRPDRSRLRAQLALQLRFVLGDQVVVAIVPEGLDEALELGDCAFSLAAGCLDFVGQALQLGERSQFVERLRFLIVAHRIRVVDPVTADPSRLSQFGPELRIALRWSKLHGWRSGTLRPRRLLGDLQPSIEGPAFAELAPGVTACSSSASLITSA